MRSIFVYILLIWGAYSCTKLPDPESSEKEILSFSVKGKTITPTKGKYEYSLDFLYSDFSSLKRVCPEIKISNGASISPSIGNEVDFTKPVIYWITAENKSAQRYVFTPVIGKNNEAQMLAFILTSSKINANIDEEKKTINLLVPYGFPLKSVTVSILVSPNATSYPESETTPLDLTLQKEFKVTAQDGTVNVYTLNLVVDKNKEALLENFALQSGIVRRQGTIINNSDPKIVTVVIPSDWDEKNLLMVVSPSYGAKISPEDIKDFSEPIRIKVTSEDGSTTNDYLIIVTKQ